MIEYLAEFLDAPRAGWPGRERWIAIQVAKVLIAAIVGTFFLAVLLLYIFTLTPGPQA